MLPLPDHSDSDQTTARTVPLPRIERLGTALVRGNGGALSEFDLAEQRAIEVTAREART